MRSADLLEFEAHYCIGFFSSFRTTLYAYRMKANMVFACLLWAGEWSLGTFRINVSNEPDAAY